MPIDKIPKNPKAVLLDMDGVVVDGMPFHLRAWKEAFSAVGIEVSDIDVYRREGMDGLETVQEISRGKGVPLTPEVERQVNESKNRILNKIFQVRFVPGSLELIRKLKARGFRLALVTGTRGEVVSRILKEGLNPPEADFDVVITAESVERKKPAPDPYLKAVELLGLRKEECLVIENAPAGIASAKGAGLRCLAITTSLPAAYLKEADAVLAGLEEVSRLFDNH
ncbi:MAG: HAD family phosphatase [Candidatus Brocadiaceae bacterium]|nr:HAD family phosphatase [Candidatus Brocadiaceae bacterium]